jgi:hypothetical protein
VPWDHPVSRPSSRNAARRRRSHARSKTTRARSSGSPLSMTFRTMSPRIRTVPHAPWRRSACVLLCALSCAWRQDVSGAHLHSAVICVSVRAVDSGKWQKTLAERYSLDDCTIGSTLHLSLILADHLYEVRAALRRPTRVRRGLRHSAASAVHSVRTHDSPPRRPLTIDLLPRAWIRACAETSGKTTFDTPRRIAIAWMNPVE